MNHTKHHTVYISPKGECYESEMLRCMADREVFDATFLRRCASLIDIQINALTEICNVATPPQNGYYEMLNIATKALRPRNNQPSDHSE